MFSPAACWFILCKKRQDMYWGKKDYFSTVLEKAGVAGGWESL